MSLLRDESTATWDERLPNLESAARDHVHKAFAEFRLAGAALPRALNPLQAAKRHPRIALVAGGVALFLLWKLAFHRRKGNGDRSAESVGHAFARSLAAHTATAIGRVLGGFLVWTAARRGWFGGFAQMRGREEE